MFCPVCRDEYRPGFTQCATCGTKLVASLDAPGASVPAPVLADATPEEILAVFCGFLTLDEARQARDKVRGAKLPADILIRETPGAAAGAPIQEEFWLRVRPRDFAAIENLIGFEPAASTGADDTFQCSACNSTVQASDDACPGCGLRFEE
jgi:hypothetical protein